MTQLMVSTNDQWLKSGVLLSSIEKCDQSLSLNGRQYLHIWPEPDNNDYYRYAAVSCTNEL